MTQTQKKPRFRGSAGACSILKIQGFAVAVNPLHTPFAKVAHFQLFPQFAFRKKVLALSAKKMLFVIFVENLNFAFFLKGFFGGCQGTVEADLLVAINCENVVVGFKFFFAGFAVHFFAFRLRGLSPPLVFKATRKFRCRP